MSTSVSDLPQPLSVQFYFVNLTSSCSLIPLYVQFPSRLPYFSSSLIDHFLPKIQVRLEEEKDSDSITVRVSDLPDLKCPLHTWRKSASRFLRNVVVVNHLCWLVSLCHENREVFWHRLYWWWSHFREHIKEPQKNKIQTQTAEKNANLLGQYETCASDKNAKKT